MLDLRSRCSMCAPKSLLLCWLLQDSYVSISKELLTPFPDVEAAFKDPISLAVIGASGLYLLFFFLAAVAIWRLFERADRVREMKEDYQRFMRGVRNGIDLLLKRGKEDIPITILLSPAATITKRYRIDVEEPEEGIDILITSSSDESSTPVKYDLEGK